MRFLAEVLRLRLVAGGDHVPAGAAAADEVLAVIAEAKSPVVIDADALNFIARRDRMEILKEN